MRFKRKMTELEFNKLLKTNYSDCVSIFCPVENNLPTTKLNFCTLVKEAIAKIDQKDDALNYELRFQLQTLEKFLKANKDFEKQALNIGETIVFFSNGVFNEVYLLTKTIQQTISIAPDFFLLPFFKYANRSQLKESERKMKELVLDSNRATNRIEKILPLACENKVETLFVTSNNGVYGLYDFLNKTTILDQDKTDENVSLINLAAILTYKNGGDVKVVEPEKMPIMGNSIQAIIR